MYANRQRINTSDSVTNKYIKTGSDRQILLGIGVVPLRGKEREHMYGVAFSEQLSFFAALCKFYSHRA